MLEDDQRVPRVVVRREDLATLLIDVDAGLKLDIRVLARDDALRLAGFRAGRRVLGAVVDEDLEEILVGQDDLVRRASGVVRRPA